MKLKADFIFKEYQYLYCRDFDDGYQIFESWAEFLAKYVRHMHAKDRPLFVNPANIIDNTAFVDAAEYIMIPWTELESYI